MTNWDYKLEAPVDEKGDQIYDRVNDMTEEELIEYAKKIGILEFDDDGEEIIPEDLEALRNEVSEYLYWEES